jgi:ADP-ribose pyrophosphatase YjhB (NUDIX family)
MAYIYPFRMASGTATMLVIDPVNRAFLNGIRSHKAWVYPGYNSLPGGFMEARWVQENESADMTVMRASCAEALGFKLIGDEFHEGENLEDCAIRELKEELSTDFNTDQLNMFAVRSNSRTDTRAHVINVCYWLEATREQINTIRAGDDLDNVAWVEFDTVLTEPIEMAFNHMEVTYQGLRAYHKHKLMEHVLAGSHVTNTVEDFRTIDSRLSILERQVANG